MSELSDAENKSGRENVYDYAKQFLFQPRFILPLLVVAGLCYGFVTTHLSVSTDDLWWEHYLKDGALLGQGRYVSPLIEALFHVFRFRPFAVDFLSVICFIFSAALLCALFKAVTGDKLDRNSYTFFACLFVSYPLIVEIFTYNGANLSVCLGYVLVAVALTENWLFLKDGRKIHAAAAVACLVLIGGMYESLFPVFLIGSFSILFLQLYTAPATDGKKLFRESLSFIAILFIAVVLKFILSKLVMIMTVAAVNTQSVNQIGWLNPYPVILFKIGKMVNGVIDHYLRAFFYMPIVELSIAFLISTVVLMVLTVKRKSLIYLYIYAGVIGSLLAISFLLLSAAGNRMCQLYAYFTAMTFMLLFDRLVRGPRMIAGAAWFLAVAITLWQCGETNKWFFVDDLRYQVEKKVVENIGLELAREYPVHQKPVVFVGSFRLPPIITKETHLSDSELGFLNKIRQYAKRSPLKEARRVQTVAEPYLAWTSMVPLGLYQFFELNGYSLIHGTFRMYKEAVRLMENRPGYPRKGYICETPEYIAVKMGEVDKELPEPSPDYF